MNELTRKTVLALLLALSGLLSGRGAEPLTTLCTGTAPTISVPAAWTDGETVPGDTILALDVHSLTGDTVTVTVDGLTATFAGSGGTFRWQPWTSGTHSLTHTAGTAVWTLRVSGTQSAAGLPAGAFRDCTNLVAVTLPSGMTAEGAGTFAGCPNLARVDVATLRDWFTVVTADTDANPLSWGVALHVSGIPVRLEGPRFDRLVIPEGVTRIPAGAFHDCPDIVSAKIPNSVTDIGSEAFSGCSGLTSVTIPSSVTSIGGSAFEGCSGLTSVTILSGVTSIGDSAFEGCSGLTSVTIPSSVTSIGGSTFEGCSGLTSVTIPDGVTSIGGWAFSGCSGLTSVTIPDGVTSIGGWAFSGCSGLTSVTIPDGVTSIGGWAFSSCSGLTDVTISSSVTSIGDSAFEGCNGLENITVDWRNPRYSSRNGMLLTKDDGTLVRGVNGDVVIPSGVASIGDGAFKGCRGLTSVVIPNSVTGIADGAFGGCTGLTSVTIPHGVTYIGDRAFSGCAGLVDVTIPSSVTRVGDNAFEGCSGLMSVTILGGVTYIGNRAFSGCTGLVDVTIPSSVTRVGDNAFEGCSGLTSVTIPGGVTSIGYEVFSGCTGLVDVTIPSSVTDIGGRVFWGCGNLVEITVDWGNPCYLSQNGLLLWVDEENGDVVLVEGVNGDVVVPDCVTRIEDYAFWGRSGLKSVAIPSGVTDIGCYAFGDCGGLMDIAVDWRNPCYLSRNGLLFLLLDEESDDVALVGGVNGDVVIPDGVVEIWDGAFEGRGGLVSVTIPDSVTSVESGAFRGCSGLMGISVTPGNPCYSSRDGLLLTKDGTELVQGVNGDVVVPNGVAGIADCAFEGCGGLKSITIPGSVTNIGWYAFGGCSELVHVRLPRRSEGMFDLESIFSECGRNLVFDYYLPDSEVAVSVDGDEPGGTVTGGGTYAAGKKVVLKATARKGYVFAGWELEGAALPEGADLQNPSLTLVAGGVDVTARARFILVSEDWAEVGVAAGSATFAEEYAAGGAFAPVTLAARGGSLATLKVSGLPAGLKFTAKALAVRDPKTKKTVSYPANTVYGKPTKSGLYTVAATATTAGGKTATARWTFAVRKPGERIARTAYDAEQGTVTGGGTYAAGKKVTLKATARKGYVFAGWELEGVALPEGADLQSPSLALVAGTSDIAAHAAFIPVEEDWAEILGALPAECAKGAAIRPATLAARGGSLVAVKVTGLPAGLKFTAKPLTVKATKTAPAASYPANTVYGTPTRSGVYTVAATATTAGRATAATNWTVVVRGPGERVVRTACDAAHGKVSGAGVYAKGKKATLKATAGKGFAFAGWELEGADLPAGADARAPSLALAVGESDVTARARFVPAGEDGTLALLVDGAEVPEDGSARFRDAGAGFALEAVSASLPKVALSGLPPGLKYDAKAGRIAGRGTKPGLYTVTAKLSNATVRRAVARTFRIEVPNLRDADALLRDGLANAPGEAYRAYVGVRAAGLPSLVPADPAHAKSLKVSSLPAGLKFDAKAVAAGEAALAGVPSKAGAYTVSVAVAGKTSTFTLEVLPLPDWAVGTFTGCFDETGADGTVLRGTAAFTVSAAGKVSAKLVRQDGKAASWTHACLDRAEADAAGCVAFRVGAVVGGFRCDVSIFAAAREGGPAQGVLAGTRRPVDAEDAGEGVVGLAFDCVQNLWGRGKALEGLAAKLKGRKVALPTIRDEQGNTYDVSLAFGAGGAVTAKYRLNGGVAQSASGTLAYRGAGELEAGGGEEDGEDGEGKTEQVAGSSVSLYLNLVRGGRAFLEVGLLVDGEGVVHWVDGRVAGDGEP